MSITKLHRRVCGICGIGFRTAHSGDYCCQFCAEQGNEYDRTSTCQDDHMNTDKVLLEFKDNYHGDEDSYIIGGHRI